MRLKRTNRCPHCGQQVAYGYRIFRCGWSFACPGCGRPLRFMTAWTSAAIVVLLALWFAWQHVEQPRMLADLAGFVGFALATVAADYFLGRLRAAPQAARPE
jgi:hypothetical protein